MKLINRRFVIAVILLIVLLTAGSVSAVGENNLIIHHVESTVNEDRDSYTVRVLLSVLNENKLPMAGLTARDFTVIEDSQPVEIDTAELIQDLSISVIVVMDVSGSMAGERLSNARTAIEDFIKSFYRGDKVAVYTFSSEIKEIIPLTSDLNKARDDFKNAEIYAGGGTCLFDATFEAAQIASDLPEGRRAVVVLSDGWDTNTGTDVCSTRTVEEIISTATEGDRRTPIYTIGIGSDIDKESLGKIADETGGVFTQSTLNTDLPLLFEQLANRLSSEYEITYTSRNMPGDRTLKIQVDGLSDSVDFVLPPLPPVISIAVPEEGQILEPKVNKIVLSLDVRGLPINTLTFQINGVAIGVGGEVGQAPHEYNIDFSQYAGQDVELTVVALNQNGVEIANTSMVIALAEEVVIVETPEETEEATTSSRTESRQGTKSGGDCSEGYICIGELEINRNQLLIVGGGALLGLLFIVIILVIFLSKKKKKKKASARGDKKESLFEDATIDGFALPGGPLGRLTILSSDDPLLVGKEYQLVKSPTTIGRSVSNDIALPKDSAVSRQHVEIVDENGRATLREMLKTLSDGTKQPPTYGTYVNDRKVTGPTTLHTGDEISLGRRTKLRYEGTGMLEEVGSSEDVTMDQISLPDMHGLDDATRDG